MIFDYDTVSQQVASMPRWQINALSAACAEKVAPLIYDLATSSSRNLARECLDFAWANLDSSVDIGKAQEFKDPSSPHPNSNVKNWIRSMPSWLVR